MRKTYSVFETLKIPGPKPVWILGNIHEFKDEVNETVTVNSFIFRVSNFL